MKRILILSLLLAMYSHFLAQNISTAQASISHVSIPAFCKTDQIHAELMLNDPEYAMIRKKYHQQMMDYMKEYIPQRALSGIVTIPVVVHVVHLGEAVGSGTNISDAQIQSAIDNMNDAYSNSGPYGNSLDLQIQFALAKRDEGCNSTNGIVRVNGTSISGYSTNGITSSNETAVKSLSKWDNGSYYNIWIVSEIDGNNGGAGTQGYAYFPGASADKDGAVMLYNAFGYDPNGTIGYTLKSYTRDNTTVIHEMGHALDLYHTFEGDGGDSNTDGVGDNCPTNSNPSTDGDMCSDTEPHKMHTSQCLSGQTNDCTGSTYSNNVAMNFMSYSSCQDRFTSNQKTRMRAALELERYSLISSLGATPVSGSSPSVAVTCQPQSTDLSNNGYGFGVYVLALGSDSTGSGGTYSQQGYVSEWCNSYSLNENTTYDVHVANGTLNAENVAVYIDYNNDGDFVDANETIFTSSNKTYHSGTFTTPTGFTGETVWVRVVSDYAGNSITGPCYAPQYGQVEDYSVLLNSAACSDPDVPSLSHSGTICDGSSATVTITGSLNDATQWVVYSGSCGGTQVTTTSSNSFSVTPSSPSTTYYVRGEGGCTSSGSCGQITLNVTSLDDASFSYDASSYCNDGADIHPTITGYGTGTFSSTPAGLDIDAGGVILLSSSLPNMYTVTYTTAGPCPNSSNVNVTINQVPDLSSTSSTDETCTGNDGSATVTPTGGSSYSYSWDASAGSQTTATATSLTAGTYNVVVQEATSGCSSNTNVTVNNNCAPAPTAAFSADVTTICEGESVTFTDESTGSPTNWEWDINGDGLTDYTTQNATHTYALAGTYTVRLSVSNSNGFDNLSKTGYIVVNALEDATFNYNQGSYCMSDSDPSPTISGTQNGSFSSTPGGLVIDPVSGAIDLSASTPNTYTVRYTTPGTCSDYHDVQVIVDGCVADTKVRADYCGNTLTSVNDAIYCDAVSGATEYEWEITDPSNNIHTYVRLNGIEYVRLSYFGLGDPNTIYSVRVRAQVNGVWGNFNTVCTVTTPASLPAVQLSASSCNITLNKIDDFFYCDDVLGADYYEWEFTDPSNNVTTYVRTNGTPNMKLVYAGLYATSTQYNVRVRGSFGGNWGPYGSSCTITSPATGLTTQVTANDCGRVLTSFTQVIYCDKVLGATYYQWKFTDASNNVKTYVRLNGTTNFKLAYINLPALNTQYDVQVRAYVNGAWQSYGPICQITSPSTSAISIADNDPEILELVKIGVFAPDPAADIEENNIFSETVVYPNPFKENLNVTFGNNEVKQITIYNAVGQVVTNMTTSESQLTISTNEFVNGVYLMQVVSDDQTKTIRLVKH